MTKKVVAVLFGGKSSEHEISKTSAYTIISNLSKEKYTVLPIYITKEGKWKIYDGPVENICNTDWQSYAADAIISPDVSHRGILRIVGDKIKVMPIDVVIPVLHGKYGEDGTIQGLLELANIPYVGCGVLSSALSMDKAYTKTIVKGLNIEQAKSHPLYDYQMDKITMDMIDKEINHHMSYPCFIKPAKAGSSKGVSKVTKQEDLEKAFEKAFLEDNKVLLQEGIDGREVECAVLGNNDIKASTVGEVLSAGDFYDFDSKYNNKESKTVIPANIDKEIIEEIKEKSIKIFRALDCKGLARVDFFIENGTNRVVFNEINTFPGFTSISMYPMLWENEGIDKQALLDTLIDLAFEQFNNKN